MNFFQRKTVWASLIIAVATAILIGFYSCSSSGVKIYPYNEQRDYQNIITQFKNKEDWYWLVDSDPSEYPFEQVIKTRTPVGEFSYLHGQMQIKVLYYNNEFAGFVTFYKHAPLIGRVLFLDIKDKFRRRGFGERLVKSAVQDLFDQGAERVWLLTRTQNERALNLYQKIGFKVFARPERYVYLEIYKPGFEPARPTTIADVEGEEEIPAQPQEICPAPAAQ